MGAENLTPEEQVTQLSARVIELEKEVNALTVKVDELETGEKGEAPSPEPGPGPVPNPEIVQVEGEITSKKSQIIVLTEEVEALEAHLKVLKGE